MPSLHNRISRKELKRRIQEDTTPRTTISFYHYTPISDPHQFRNQFYLALKALDALGRIYIAEEGINAQMNIPSANLDAFKNELYSIPGFNGLRLNIAVDNQQKSFFVLDVKVRNKIVADGIEDPSFSMENKGRYVNAAEFNQLTEDPNTVVIDMRNHYEYEVGHLVVFDAKKPPPGLSTGVSPMSINSMAVSLITLDKSWNKVFPTNSRGATLSLMNEWASASAMMC